MSAPSRLLCLLRRDHWHKPRDGGARGLEDRVDIACGRCGQLVVVGVPTRNELPPLQPPRDYEDHEDEQDDEQDGRDGHAAILHRPGD